MDYGVKPVTYVCKCSTCGKHFLYTSCGTGPVNMCDFCRVSVLSVIYGEALHRDPVYGTVIPMGRSSIG